jgi:NADP-dependent 3-hydroxy acid dehydrogenase YdfG
VSSALVTGASAGIGLAIAETLCREGHAVTMVARREPRLSEAASSLQLRGFDVHAVAADVAGTDVAERLVADHVSRFGGLDVLVANAGRGTAATVVEAAPSEIERMLQVNVTSAFALAAAAIPALRVSHGWFIAMASMSGVWPTTGVAAYSATKAAAVSLARSIAAEEAESGVRACAICPAFVDTDFTAWLDGAINPADMLTADDVAETVRFLLRLSPAASVTEIVLRRVTAPSPLAP